MSSSSPGPCILLPLPPSPSFSSGTMNLFLFLRAVVVALIDRRRRFFQSFLQGYQPIVPIFVHPDTTVARAEREFLKLDFLAFRSRNPAPNLSSLSSLASPSIFHHPRTVVPSAQPARRLKVTRSHNVVELFLPSQIPRPTKYVFHHGRRSPRCSSLCNSCLSTVVTIAFFVSGDTLSTTSAFGSTHTIPVDTVEPPEVLACVSKLHYDVDVAAKKRSQRPPSSCLRS